MRRYAWASIVGAWVLFTMGARGHAQPAPVDAAVTAPSPAEVVAEVEPLTLPLGVAAEVTPPSMPTNVRAAVTMLSLNRVSAPNESFAHFDATVMLSARWVDPRVAFTATSEADDRHVFLGDEATAMLNRIWWPDLTIRNQDGERSVQTRTLIIRDEGTVTYEEVFAARFRSRFDLRSFPFDDQEFAFRIQSLAWNSREVVLAPLESRMDIRAVGRVQDWTLGETSFEAMEVTQAHSGRPFSVVRVAVTASREPGFYISKVMLPLLMIVIITWTTFWMTGEPASARMQRGFIALLAIVAFSQVISQHLPRIPYVTFLDALLFFAFASTGATLLQVVATHRADLRGDKERAARLDRIARVAFPLAFVVVLGGLSVLYGAR